MSHDGTAVETALRSPRSFVYADDDLPVPEDLLDEFENGPFLVRAQSAVNGISPQPLCSCTCTTEGGILSCVICAHGIMPLPPAIASRMLFANAPNLSETLPRTKAKPNRRMADTLLDTPETDELARQIAKYQRMKEHADKMKEHANSRLKTIREHQRERRPKSPVLSAGRRGASGELTSRSGDSSVTVSSRTTMALNGPRAGKRGRGGCDEAEQQTALLQEAKEKLDRAFMRKESDPEWRKRAMTLNMSEWESLCESPFEGPRRDTRDGRETMGRSSDEEGNGLVCASDEQFSMDRGEGAASHDHIRATVCTQARSPEERLCATQSGGEQRDTKYSDAARPERRGAGRAWSYLLYSLLGVLVVGFGIGCFVYLDHRSSTPQPPVSQPPGFLEPGPSTPAEVMVDDLPPNTNSDAKDDNTHGGSPASAPNGVS